MRYSLAARALTWIPVMGINQSLCTSSPQRIDWRINLGILAAFRVAVRKYHNSQSLMTHHVDALILFAGAPCDVFTCLCPPAGRTIAVVRGFRVGITYKKRICRMPDGTSFAPRIRSVCKPSDKNIIDRAGLGIGSQKISVETITDQI